MYCANESWVNGYMNKQNYWILDGISSYEIEGRLKHPEKALIFGVNFELVPSSVHIFLKNNIGQTIIANRERYRSMITNVFCYKLGNLDVNEMTFQ